MTLISEGPGDERIIISTVEISTHTFETDDYRNIEDRRIEIGNTNEPGMALLFRWSLDLYDSTIIFRGISESRSIFSEKVRILFVKIIKNKQKSVLEKKL